MESALVSKSQEEQESLTIEQGEGEVETENNNYQLMIIPAAKDYECRYCPKKFSNKQALGGHQNAHKDLRAMEKETAGNGFFGMVPSFRHPDFLHRPSSYNWNFNLVPYNHCPGFNGGCVHRPWSSRFPPLRLPNFGPGTSNDFRSASHQGQGYPEFPTGFGIPPPSRNRPINLRNVPEVVDDESGIDLSLRLGYHDHV